MKAIHENSVISYAENEESGKGATYRQKIVSLLKETGRPMTDRQIFETLNTDINNIRPEITRLKQAGILTEAGKVKCPVTKKTVRTVCMKFKETLF